MQAGLVLGFGLSMFFDGIVFHQLLQWHHLVSFRDPVITTAALQQQVFWDGVFHSAAYVVMALGLVLLWRAAAGMPIAKSRRMLLGYLLVGFGGFNIVDSIVSHGLLQLHHVRDDTPNWLVYDIVFFFIAGVLVTAIGWWLTRSPPRSL